MDKRAVGIVTVKRNNIVKLPEGTPLHPNEKYEVINIDDGVMLRKCLEKNENLEKKLNYEDPIGIFKGKQHVNFDRYFKHKGYEQLEGKDM